jgi:hypothetical protein
VSYDPFVFKGPIPRPAPTSRPAARSCCENIRRSNFAWPEAERVAKEVPKLAQKHGLTLMDPQSGLIVRP